MLPSKGASELRPDGGQRVVPRGGRQERLDPDVRELIQERQGRWMNIALRCSLP